MLSLPRSTKALLEAAESLAVARALPQSGLILDVGSHAGAVALATGGIYVHTDLLACKAAHAAGVPDVRHTDLLPPDPFSIVCFDGAAYDPGLAAETVAAIAARLTPGGVLLTTAPAADVQAAFTTVARQGDVLIARAPRPQPDSEAPAQASGGAPALSRYTAEFDGHAYTLLTGPGVFAPRGLDEGTRLMLAEVRTTPGARLLDLGCGVGVVSRIAAEAWQCHVTAVDVNARALRLTALNAPQAEVLASDGFSELKDRQFDVIVSNPPYHTDFAVAKAFIEGAFTQLAAGGSLYLVVKRADWYVQKVRHRFGGCRLTAADGYTVITAEKRAPRADGEAIPHTRAQPATTRKHAKRIAAAGKKRNRP